MKNNIYKEIPKDLNQEIIETLISSESIKIERIISNGQASPPGFYYDQCQNEWVILLKGQASIKYESGDEILLSEGDYLNIPAHVKHRVEWTMANTKNIWLAIFYD